MANKFRRQSLIVCLLVLAAAVAAVAYGKKKDKAVSNAAQMEGSKRALHALQRLTFGPRPGEVERVAAMGVDKWIDAQLHPENIDDHPLDARLAPFRTLRMDTREMVENFPPPPLIKAVMEGRQPMPSDPVKRAIYRSQIERLEEKRERKQTAAPKTNAALPANGQDNDPTSEEPCSRRDGRKCRCAGRNARETPRKSVRCGFESPATTRAVTRRPHEGSAADDAQSSNARCQFPSRGQRATNSWRA